MIRSLDFIENWDDEKINSKNSKCVSFFLTFGRTKLKRCPNLSGVIRKYRKNIQNCSTCFLFITPVILLKCERVFIIYNFFFKLSRLIAALS